MVMSPIVAAMVLFAPPTGGRDRDVVGTWHYDAKTMKIDLSAKYKKAVAEDANVRAQWGQMESNLRALIGKVQLKFMGDHRLTVSVPGEAKTVSGKWSLKGSKVLVVMDRPGQSVPDLTLAANGKSMATRYTYGDFGTARLLLLKR